MKSKIITISLLFTTAIIWGFAFVAQFFGASEVGPFAMNGLRFPLGTLSLLPVMLIFERKRMDAVERKKTVRSSLIIGSVLFFATTFQQIGIIITGVGVTSIITGLYTVFIPIACYVLFRHKTGLNVIVAAILAVIGIFMLCMTPGEGFSFGIGEFFALIGSFFWTAHVVLVDRLGKELRPLHLSFGQFTVCSFWCVLATVISFRYEPFTLDSVIAAAPSILYAGVLSVGVAYTLQVVSQRRADPTLAAIILSTESLFGALGGALFGIDNISPVGYFGCVIMFAGIVISQLDFAALRAKRKAIKNSSVNSNN